LVDFHKFDDAYIVLLLNEI